MPQADTSKAAPKSSWWRDQFRPAILLHGLARALVVGAAIGSFLGLLGSTWWVFDLASHFRVQYLLAAVVGTWLAIVGRRYWLLGLALGVVLLNGWFLSPSLAPRPSLPQGDPLRILFVNVNSSNRDTGAVVALIRKSDADVVGIMEITDRWQAQLAPALTAYPHRVEQTREDNFGIALYSRKPWRKARVEHYGEARLPSIRARLQLPRSRVTLLFTHPPPPISTQYARWRRGQLEAIHAHHAELPEPRVIFGDLNASPWSRDFRWFASRMRLADSRRGFGPQRTWPASSWLLRIPIDHCLVSRQIGVRSRRLGPDVGSDHLPVIVDLIVAANP